MSSPDAVATVQRYLGLFESDAKDVVRDRLGDCLQAIVSLRLLASKDGRRRMSDLADALLLSRGGATRLVAKAVEDGLVTREIPPDDRRATFAVLTDAGRAVAERGFPVYLEAVQRLFQDFVTDDEAEVLVRIWNRVLEGNDMACGPVSEAAAALPQRA